MSRKELGIFKAENLPLSTGGYASDFYTGGASPLYVGGSTGLVTGGAGPLYTGGRMKNPNRVSAGKRSASSNPWVRFIKANKKSGKSFRQLAAEYRKKTRRTRKRRSK
jgi:hypothetical protein